MKTTTSTLVLLAAALPALAFGPARGWDDVLDRHDEDGDGRIAATEFPHADRFATIDADGDGFVLEDEWTAHRSSNLLAFVARRADADGDGTVTAGEWEEWFAAADRDGDGRLDAADRPQRGPSDERGGPGRHHAGRHGGAPGPSAFDADGDGGVTEAELLAAVAAADTDGDGALSAAELPDVPHLGRHGRRGGPSHGPGPGMSAERCSAHLDADGDGAVSRGEWEAAKAARPGCDAACAAARFDELDANGDGLLSGDELPRHRRPRR